MRRSTFVRWLWTVAVALFIAWALPAVSRASNEEGGDPPPNDDVPEFDMGTAGAAVALLSGGILVLKARRRRRMAA